MWAWWCAESVVHRQGNKLAFHPPMHNTCTNGCGWDAEEASVCYARLRSEQSCWRETMTNRNGLVAPHSRKDRQSTRWWWGWCRAGTAGGSIVRLHPSRHPNQEQDAQDATKGSSPLLLSTSSFPHGRARTRWRGAVLFGAKVGPRYTLVREEATPNASVAESCCHRGHTAHFEHACMHMCLCSSAAVGLPHIAPANLGARADPDR